MRLAGVEQNPAGSAKLIRPKVNKRDLALRMSWAEAMAVLHKLQKLCLQPKLAVLGSSPAPACDAPSSRR
jgi:hypothetical protein